ncbi:metallophosphoesterase family protein [Sorangium sp. So ce854]|uniref:metallophosphoesterase family protein n=1 Tax=Sorangium sp. So ce854 TaxID=3133322 RepID=UPI003F5FE134
MERQETGDIIVNHAQVQRLLGNRGEAVTSELTPEGDATEWGARLVGFRRGLAELRARQTEPDVLSSADHPVGALLQSYLAERAEEEGALEPVRTGGFEVAIDDKDYLGWVRSFFTWWGKLQPHEWVQAPTAPEAIPNTIRIAVLGDWGSGLYGAPVCAQSVARDPKGYGLILHLGDVYYSGTRKEVGTRFLRYWPNVAGALGRAVNANHEMYSGGHGYYDIILNALHQPSSVFALQNEHWLVVGLDTGYVEHDLAHDQAQWLAMMVEAAGDRRVLVFSHHQPFSLFERQGAKLQTKLRPLLEAGRITAWYWGHEHRCVIYDQHAGWGLLGRCIGHSGYPYFRDSLGNAPRTALPGGHELRRVERAGVPPGLVLDGPNPHVIGHEQKYGPHGYASLELRDGHLDETIHAADGTVLWQRQLA